MARYDYVIVGSGIAGLYTALLAQEHGTVLILTKGNIDDCNTRYAQGGIAASIGQGDSPELHMHDTLKAGAGLCDADAVGILTQQASDRIADLIRYGVPFDTAMGEIALAREGAHSVARVLHAGGDATGRHIELTLADLARKSRVTVLENTLALRVLAEEGQASGIEALDTKTGDATEFQGRFVVLATGGGGQLYRYTTNPEVATGDGVALAYRAGATVVDVEFLQFHPTALHLEGTPPFLISEAVRGEGGVLRNGRGEVFMSKHDPQADLATRDVVARAMVMEMQRDGAGHVYLDVTHLPQQRVAARFPSIHRFCLDHGLDITREPIPVAPAAHYMMGGVKTDSWGRTSVANLYACGETASLGVHGANRLASNSLLETLVFGKRVVDHTLGTVKEERQEGDPKELMATPPKRALTCASVPRLTLKNLQGLMWEKVGLLRSGVQLLGAVRILSVWSATAPRGNDRSSQELANLVQVGLLTTEAALMREESRGAHYRTDYPDTSPEWEKHIVLRKGN